MIYNIEYLAEGDRYTKSVNVNGENPFAAVQNFCDLYISDNSRIVSVRGDGEKSLSLGKTYKTMSGVSVRMMEVHNAGFHHETMSDQFGIHRYSRSNGHIVGRCTGSPINDPLNIILGHCWFDPHFDHETKQQNVTYYRTHGQEQTDFVDVNGDQTHVRMKYRGYVIERIAEEWGFYLDGQEDDKAKWVGGAKTSKSIVREDIDRLIDGDSDDN